MLDGIVDVAEGMLVPLLKCIMGCPNFFENLLTSKHGSPQNSGSRCVLQLQNKTDLAPRNLQI